MSKKQALIYILILLLGFGIFLYPSVSNAFQERRQKTAIEAYEQSVSAMDESEAEEMLLQAQAYNSALSRGDLASSTYYANTLGLDEAMGTLTIPKLALELPIYHGTSEKVLQRGIGHLEGTSLPLGENGTHAVLTGHRGLPSAELFTHIDELTEGDSFFVKVLNTVSEYRVVRVTIIDPEAYKSEVFSLNPDKALITLLTCHPYGVNTHRLLITAEKQEQADMQALDAYTQARAQQLTVKAETDGDAGSIQYFVGTPQRITEIQAERGIDRNAVLLIVFSVVLLAWNGIPLLRRKVA